MSAATSNEPPTSWWYALWLIVPSLLVTALAWWQFHSVPIAPSRC